MSDKKINLVFDVTIFILGKIDKTSRTGIYFASLNIINELYKNPNFNISFYCDRKLIPLIKDIEVIQKYNCDLINYKDLSDDFWKFYNIKQKRKELKKQNFKRFLLKFKQLYYLQKFKLINKKINIHQYDYTNIFFSPCFKIPDEIKELKHIQKYIVLYDTIPIKFPQYFPSLKNKNYWYTQLMHSINFNDFYFSISEATKRDFIKYVPTIDPEHITTTLLACNEAFRPEPEKTKASLEKYNLPTDKKYIFSLCTLEPRKNLIRAAKTFIQFIEKHKINDLIFILGGGSWEGFIEKLEKEVPDFDKYRDKIIKAGYIDDEDLAPLYSGAEWFVYTSQYEGFGLPPLEAMSCGCAVITSNNSSLPEVVGDAGIMIDWDNEEEHVQAYEKYYFNPEIRNEYAQKGLERAKQFSWQKCTDEMVKVMKKEFEKENL